MTDTLETDAPLRGLLQVYLGYARISDNHNNSMTGRELTCGGGNVHRVGMVDFAWLVNSIGEAALGALPDVASKITFNGMKSPLEIECHALAIANPAPASREKKR